LAHRQQQKDPKPETKMEQLFIIKIGGNIIDHPGSLEKFLGDFSEVKGFKLLVHGGGKVATEVSSSLGIESKIVEGRRITDADTLKVITMVYAGLINKNIVARLQGKKCNAIGLTGADANCLPAKKRAGHAIDYGFVGDPVKAAINTLSIDLLLKNGFTPVVAPLTHDGDGNLLNTNADTIAAVLAVALSRLYKVKLVYCFEKKGVLRDPQSDDSVIPHINAEECESLKQQGVIGKGMIPKIDNAFDALREGVSAVHICHADDLPDITSRYAKAGTVLTVNKEDIQ
jgi:acetylglutamate kinase